MLISGYVLSQAPSPIDAGGGMGFWLVVLALLSVLPFFLTMITSFAKLVIVFGILRQAIGTQQIPPNSVITGLAMILTVHIMAPTFQQIYANYTAAARPDPQRSAQQVADDFLGAAVDPIEQFFKRNTPRRDVDFFESLQARRVEAAAAGQGAPIQLANPLYDRAFHDLTVLTPAFILSELTKAFQIGFILYVPFLVLDLVVSNITLAMGMSMIPPSTFSLPLKLLLFVLIDGWRLLMQGLVLGYS